MGGLLRLGDLDLPFPPDLLRLEFIEHISTRTKHVNKSLFLTYTEHVYCLKIILFAMHFLPATFFRIEDPTFFFHGFGSAEEEKSDPDPTLNRNEKKIYILVR